MVYCCGVLQAYDIIVGELWPADVAVLHLRASLCTNLLQLSLSLSPPSATAGMCTDWLCRRSELPQGHGSCCQLRLGEPDQHDLPHKTGRSTAPSPSPQAGKEAFLIILTHSTLTLTIPKGWQCHISVSPSCFKWLFLSDGAHNVMLSGCVQLCALV